MRRSVLPLMLLGALGLLPIVGNVAEADGTRHPYFDDRGTLDWYHSFAEARRVAAAEGKLIFIESGRRQCTQCRKICSQVLPDRSVRARLSTIAIGLAAECDRPEREIALLFRQHLPNPKMLPLVGFVTPDGSWVAGFWGSRSVAQFEGDLTRAEAAWRRWNASAPCRPGHAPKTQVPRPATPPEPEPEEASPEAGERPSHGSIGIDGPGDDDCCCDDGCCPGGMCTPPPMLPDLLSDDCIEPGAVGERLDADGRIPELLVGFPEPTVGDLARPSPGRGMPAPPIGTVHVAVGDPDAVTVEPAPISRERSMKAATRITPASTARLGAARKAELAAAREQWAEVVRLTERAGQDPELLTLNRRAHAWAHESLRRVVEQIQAGEIEAARDQVLAVQSAMAGQPESVDARRGLDAIEFVQDLAYLPDDSLVRRAVQKNAYEKMRGSRWAALFR